VDGGRFVVTRNRARGADFEILHSFPSRIRIHIPEWRNLESSALEHRLRLVPGVAAVLANPLTRNLLIHFDPPHGAKERALKLIDIVLSRC
jgi:hypothetical protein